MILGDSEIKRMMAEGYFPAYPKLLINPASLNVRIGTSFLVPQRKWFGSVALGDEIKYKKIVLQKGKAFKLRPGQFALATTIESINLPLHLAAFVQGRSSIGRAGLTVQNAGFIDPGFHGHITLELKNETKNTILICPGYLWLRLCSSKRKVSSIRTLASIAGRRKQQEAECTLIKFLAESLVTRRTVLRRVFYPRK